MTDQEIDKWVEEHVTAPEDSDIIPAVLEWGKIVAHKFYDLGWEKGYNEGWDGGFDCCKKSLNVD